MNRANFLKITGLTTSSLIINPQAMLANLNTDPELFYFKDDGSIPNSKFPLLLYHDAFAVAANIGGDWIEKKFADNNWTNSWRWRVYPFHHYHSNTHEVLGVFSGSALLHLGGEAGRKVNVQAGNVIVIPAGVGHKCINNTEDFTVVGAYPNGLSPDLKKGEKDHRPEADKNIAAVAIPLTDPLLGQKAGLLKFWK